MKKLIFLGTMALIAVTIIISCQKEVPNPGHSTAQNTQTTNNSNQKQKPTVSVQMYKMVWDASGKWTCVCCGDNCAVSASAVYPNETVNLSVLQVLKLMEIGNLDLNDYFVKKQSELHADFANLYEGNMLGQIASGKVKLTFEFPFLFFSDNKGMVLQAFNYESTLTDQNVISALKAAGPIYDKVVKLNLDPNKPVVWICTDPGTNCATTSTTSKFRFYPEWIRDNPKYIYIPTKDAISKSVLTKDRLQLELTTTTNDFFVVNL